MVEATCVPVRADLRSQRRVGAAVGAPGRARSRGGRRGIRCSRSAGVCRMCSRAVRADPDAVFAALLTEAAAGQPIAARVVLQAMLGKVVRLAQAHPDVGVDEFVSALWCRIRTYPLARRPPRIAANLALDTRKDVLAGTRRRAHESSVGSLSEPGVGAAAAPASPTVRRWTDNEERLVEARRVIEAARAIGLIDAATDVGPADGVSRRRDQPGRRTLARHHPGHGALPMQSGTPPDGPARCRHQRHAHEPSISTIPGAVGQEPPSRSQPTNGIGTEVSRGAIVMKK